jgi:hypothetical protein
VGFHDSTPKSILDAPVLTPVLISEQPHPNRFARRKHRGTNGKLFHIPKRYQQPARNEPYVKVAAE